MLRTRRIDGRRVLILGPLPESNAPWWTVVRALSAICVPLWLFPPAFYAFYRGADALDSVWLLLWFGGTTLSVPVLSGYACLPPVLLRGVRRWAMVPAYAVLMGIEFTAAVILLEWFGLVDGF